MKKKANWAYLEWDQSKNRSELSCYDCMNHNKCRWRKTGKRFSSLLCKKTAGFFQDKLHYILEGLNLQEKIIFCNNRNKKCDGLSRQPNFTTITGTDKWLKYRLAEVLSEGFGTSGNLGLHLGNLGVDLSIQTNWGILSLIAGKPKGSQINFWVYLRVFGFAQWAAFISLLIGFVVTMTIVKDMSNGNGESRLSNVLSSIATAYYYTFQLGEHHDERRHRGSTTLLTLTLSLLTMFIWIYYTGDITAEMTSGPGPHPVKNFDDVIKYDYEVISQNQFYGALLRYASTEAQRDVYNMYLRERKQGELKYTTKLFLDPFDIAYGNPRKLLYGALSSYALQTKLNRTLMAGLTWLKIDEKSRSHSGFLLQNNSEFLQVFNHYIMKMMETGILKRLQKKQLYASLYVNEDFGLSEPQPLSFTNVLFLFNVLGVGIVTSIGILFVEWTMSKWHRWRNHQVLLFCCARVVFQNRNCRRAHQGLLLL